MENMESLYNRKMSHLSRKHKPNYSSSHHPLQLQQSYNNALSSLYQQNQLLKQELMRLISHPDDHAETPPLRQLKHCASEPQQSMLSVRGKDKKPTFAWQTPRFLLQSERKKTLQSGLYDQDQEEEQQVRIDYPLAINDPRLKPIVLQQSKDGKLVRNKQAQNIIKVIRSNKTSPNKYSKGTPKGTITNESYNIQHRAIDEATSRYQSQQKTLRKNVSPSRFYQKTTTTQQRGNQFVRSPNCKSRRTPSFLKEKTKASRQNSKESTLKKKVYWNEEAWLDSAEIRPQPTLTKHAAHLFKAQHRQPFTPINKEKSGRASQSRNQGQNLAEISESLDSKLSIQRILWEGRHNR